MMREKIYEGDGGGASQRLIFKNYDKKIIWRMANDFSITFLRINILNISFCLFKTNAST